MTAETGMKKMKKMPIGISDFKNMIEGNYCYVDKSLFIKEVVDRGDSIILLPRPRRFGKTLNLSMLKYFYDCCPNTWRSGSEPPAKRNERPEHSNRHLFQSLAIHGAGSEYLEKIGRHPVIFLSFRTIKELDWDTAHRKIKKLIQEEFLKHDYLLTGSKLNPHDKDYFRKIVDLEGDHEDYESSLKKLLVFLNLYYSRRAVVLIDEYDAPIHAGFSYGYYEEIINFMRNFLGGGLKDTDQYLEKSVLTGIMRVAKESIFSGLNNLGVYTLVSEEFNQHFGFTEREMESLLKEFQLGHLYNEVQRWYNGYRFGTATVYNPWSIINFLGSSSKELKPFWLNTSDNRIVETLLSKGGKELKKELEQLISGQSIEKPISENIILKQVPLRDEFLWSFLLMGGYLKQTAKRRDEGTGKLHYSLSIPNLEVRIIYGEIIDVYFADKIGSEKLEIMLKALLDGDIDVFEELFGEYVIKSMSFFDTAAEPEKVYHAFVMGLFIWLSPRYEIKSNRESGYGRYDIMLIPRDKNKLGFVIEFKTVRKKETLETAIKSALDQIEEKKYETELVERGIQNIKKLAVVFSGKDVYIKEAI